MDNDGGRRKSAKRALQIEKKDEITETDRQLALLKFSIEAGILLCGNGVSRHVGCTHARTHARLQSPK